MKKNLQTAFSPRQYMLSQDFEIYYYNDTGLRNVGSHSHDYFEFYFFLEGEVTMHLGKKQYRPSYGSLAIIPPGLPHYVAIGDPDIPYRRFVFWMSRSYLEELSATSAAYRYLYDLAMPKGYVTAFEELTFNGIQAKVFSLLDEVHSQRFGREARLPLCVSDLLLTISRTVYEAGHPAAYASDMEDLYQGLLMFIDSHIEEDLSLERLSRLFYVSKYHISHVFTENMGYPLHRYVTKKRLSLCRDAIRNGNGVTEACAAYGFSDYSAFYRAFVKEYGKSPKKYRDEILRQSLLM